MTRPKAYEPEHGYMFQILTRQPGERTWESCDYAVSRTDRSYLISEYRAGSPGTYYKSVPLPPKYWAPKKEREAHDATLPPRANWTDRAVAARAATQRSPFGPGA